MTEGFATRDGANLDITIDSVAALAADIAVDTALAAFVGCSPAAETLVVKILAACFLVSPGKALRTKVAARWVAIDCRAPAS